MLLSNAPSPSSASRKPSGSDACAQPLTCSSHCAWTAIPTVPHSFGLRRERCISAGRIDNAQHTADCTLACWHVSRLPRAHDRQSAPGKGRPSEPQCGPACVRNAIQAVVAVLAHFGHFARCSAAAEARPGRGSPWASTFTLLAGGDHTARVWKIVDETHLLFRMSRPTHSARARAH